MSSVYLIRHGQAGTRQRYDDLSAEGRTQARLLGEHLVAQGIAFHAAIAGNLARQRQTAEEVSRAYAAAGLPFPQIAAEPAWNEFDLDAVYHDMVPPLRRADARFCEAYTEIERQSADESAAIHHKWSWCDVEIIRAWIEGRFPCATESWSDFHGRVSQAPLPAGELVAVFTSAVPIGIRAAVALGIHDHRAMRLGGVLYNASYSVMRASEGETSLFSFNHVPHLPPHLRTFR